MISVEDIDDASESVSSSSVGSGTMAWADDCLRSRGAAMGELGGLSRGEAGYRAWSLCSHNVGREMALVLPRGLREISCSRPVGAGYMGACVGGRFGTAL